MIANHIHWDSYLKKALYAFALIIFLIISLSIHLSMLTVPFYTVIHGSDEYVAGMPAAFRFVVINPLSNRYISDYDLELRLVYKADGNDFKLYKAHNTNREAFAVNVNIPHKVGKASILGTVNTKAGKEQFSFDVHIKPQAGPLNAVRQAAKHIIYPNRQKKHCCFPKIQSDILVQAYTPGGLLNPLMENELFLWASKDQKGQQATIQLQHPLTTLQTNELGIASLTIKPEQQKYYSLEFILPSFNKKPHMQERQNHDSMSDQTENIVKLHLQAPPSQMQLQTAQVIISPQTEIPVQLKSLRSRGIVYLDIWYGSSLIQSGEKPLQDRKASWQFQPPAKRPGLYLLQAYQPFMNPGTTEDSRLLYVPKSPQNALAELITAIQNIPGPQDPLLHMLAQKDQKQLTPQRALLAKLITGSVKRPNITPTIQYNSKHHKLEELDRQKTSISKLLKLTYIFIALLGLIAIITIFWFQHQRTKKNLQALLDEQEMDDERTDYELNSQDVKRIANMPAFISITVVFSVILLGLWAIYLLIQNLRWRL